MQDLHLFFRPEFLNRLDDMIVFRPLGVAQIKQIVEIQLASLAGRLADRRITLQLTEAAKSHIALAGYDPVFGARPLKRAIQNEIMNPLATRILAGEIRDGQTITVDATSEGFTFLPQEAGIS
jgi:ATP-dependent Clp protease ATP-binding subunit ClpB